MNCEFCGGKTITKKVRKQHWRRKKLYIVENVEAEVCRECGERYYHAKVLDHLDSYLEKDHQVIEHLDVEVVKIA